MEAKPSEAKQKRPKKQWVLNKAILRSMGWKIFLI